MNYAYDRPTIVKINRRLRVINRALITITAILSLISAGLMVWASTSMVV